MSVSVCVCGEGRRCVVGGGVGGGGDCVSVCLCVIYVVQPYCL